MRIARFEVCKHPPEISNENRFEHISVQPTWFGRLVCTPKHFFFVRNAAKNLGIPELTERFVEDLWDNHESGEIFEMEGKAAYETVFPIIKRFYEKMGAV